MSAFIRAFVGAFLPALLLPFSALAEDLPSWNDGKAKQAIIDCVTKVSDEKNADYVKPEDRI